MYKLARGTSIKREKITLFNIINKIKTQCLERIDASEKDEAHPFNSRFCTAKKKVFLIDVCLRYLSRVKGWCVYEIYSHSLLPPKHQKASTHLHSKKVISTVH